jgi:hypothetical protein
MYRLEQFGTATLPQADFNSDISPAQALTSQVQGGGTSYDALRSDAAMPRLPYTLPHRCTVMETSLAAMRTTIDTWRSLVGVRAILYRRALDDNTVHWAWARLIAMPETRQPQQLFAQPIDLQFSILSSWHGNHHGAPLFYDDPDNYFDTGLVWDASETTVLNTSPKNITVTNGGKIATTDVNIQITAGSAAITNVVIAKPYGNVSWYYDGTIAIGKSLVVKGASKSVLNDSVGDWDHFHLNAAHSIEPWLRMAVGANVYRVTLTGGSTDSEITFEFSDGWA